VSVRTDALPELVNAWQAAARDLAANSAIQIGIADFGGTRTQADTTLILGYRDQDYAVYAAQMKAAGKTPQSKAAWRPIQPYMGSFHDFGAARDAEIVSKPAGMSYDDAVKTIRAAMQRAGLRGISSPNDLLHFELVQPLTTVRDWWNDYQNHTGRYADASDGGDTDDADDGSGDDVGDGGDMQTTPTGKAVLGALVSLAVVGGAWVLYRRFTS
jgi:hypothetical protein